MVLRCANNINNITSFSEVIIQCQLFYASAETLFCHLDLLSVQFALLSYTRISSQGFFMPTSSMGILGQKWRTSGNHLSTTFPRLSGLEMLKQSRTTSVSGYSRTNMNEFLQGGRVHYTRTPAEASYDRGRTLAV